MQVSVLATQSDTQSVFDPQQPVEPKRIMASNVVGCGHSRLVNGRLVGPIATARSLICASEGGSVRLYEYAAQCGAYLPIANRCSVAS